MLFSSIFSRDHLDLPDLQAPPANKDLKAHPATQAQTPNIAHAHHEAAWSTAAALSLCFAISTKRAI